MRRRMLSDASLMVIVIEMIARRIGVRCHFCDHPGVCRIFSEYNLGRRAKFLD
jgi:hypothetical protein